MCHKGKHQMGWFQKHSLDIWMAFGMLVVLGLPVWLWMIGAV
jgi:hypothetical protein